MFNNNDIIAVYVDENILSKDAILLSNHKMDNPGNLTYIPMTNLGSILDMQYVCKGKCYNCLANNGGTGSIVCYASSAEICTIKGKEICNRLSCAGMTELDCYESLI